VKISSDIAKYQENNNGKYPPSLNSTNLSVPKGFTIYYRAADLDKSAPAEMIIFYIKSPNGLYEVYFADDTRKTLEADPVNTPVQIQSFAQALERDNQLRREMNLTEKQPEFTDDFNVTDKKQPNHP